MSLRRLAVELIRMSRHESTTPVLVTPVEITLRADFYAALAKDIASEGGCGTRFDLVSPVGGFLQAARNILASWNVRRINRTLRQCNAKGLPVELALTANIARPASIDNFASSDQNDAQSVRPIVVGICHGLADLPKWTSPIHLTGSPNSETSLQSRLVSVDLAH
ncbi:hypothetical protein CA13_70220 [Planctomycetes bacterium CA13]|uniref:Uncharacterized protein n=1 Tax=Novipirellula herctigrandis TaxID=2527986 RepID=A0A5C5YNW4_9BACT|nr:hypothetical protein CA13_70220 [Planctomycetes bacterium CA13]